MTVKKCKRALWSLGENVVAAKQKTTVVQALVMSILNFTNTVWIFGKSDKLKCSLCFMQR